MGAGGGPVGKSVHRRKERAAVHRRARFRGRGSDPADGVLRRHVDIVTDGQTVHPVTEAIKVWTVRVRALRPKYYLAGQIVKVGAEHDVPLGDARDMAAQGWVEIVGTPRLESTGVLASVPPRERERARW